MEIRLFYFWSFDRMRVRMTAVSLKTAKQTGLTIPVNVLVRAALAEVMLKPDQIHDLLSICATMSVVRSA